jgi:hypothetical protein
MTSMVAGLLRAATGHIFGSGNHGDHGDGRLEVCESAHGAEHGGAAAHVVLHFLHVVGGLDGDTAGIEGDGFADEAEDGRVGPGVFGSVANDDNARRLDAALRNADKRSHFQFGDFALVKDLDAEADFFGHGFGFRGEDARGETVRGLVDQVAREVHGFADDAAVLEGFFRVVRRVEAGEHDGLNFLFVFFLLVGLVLVGLEVGDDEAFGDSFDGAGPAVAFTREEDDFLRAEIFQITERGASDLPQVGNGELVGLPCSDDQEPLSLETLWEVNERERERLAGNFPGGSELREAVIDRLIQVRDDAFNFVVLIENVRYKCI